jgi:putative flavoprotein involved in K+ transport
MELTNEVVVVGAGQAGLSVSCLLSLAGIDHIVLERGRIGESWRSQRWDSFHLNTPNWSNGLTGIEFHPEKPNEFSDSGHLIAYFERYASKFKLPIREQTPVISLEDSGTGGYVLQTEDTTYHTNVAVMATGAMSRPKLPDVSKELPGDILALTAGSYRNSEQLPDGAVLVVGSGQSGCQIVEDLLSAGREVYLCASRVGRAPRTYRGRDIFDWWREMKFFEVRLDELADPSVQFAAQPQVSGTDGGHTISLQSLARDGAILLGRLEGVDGCVLQLGDNLHECIEFGDEKANDIRKQIDDYIEQFGIVAKPPVSDPGEPALPDLNGSDSWATLDLRQTGVTTIIWCTGFETDWSWVKLDVFDDRGYPRHRAGITDYPGLYVLGSPWINKRKSGILYGVSEDASNIVEHIVNYLQSG